MRPHIIYILQIYESQVSIHTTLPSSYWWTWQWHIPTYLHRWFKSKSVEDPYLILYTYICKHKYIYLLFFHSIIQLSGLLFAANFYYKFRLRLLILCCYYTYHYLPWITHTYYYYCTLCNSGSFIHFFF